MVGAKVCQNFAKFGEPIGVDERLAGLTVDPVV